MTRVEWFVMAATAALVGGLLAASQFYDHYAYATAAFVGMALGVVLSRYLTINGGLPRRVGWAAAAAAVVLVAVFVIPDDTSRVSSYMAGAAPVTPTIDADIPAGSCVASDYPIYLIEANRWETSRPCTNITDPFGMFVSTEGIQPPGFPSFPPALVTPWVSAFRSAQYVVLTYGRSNFVPFSPAVIAMFRQKFVLITRTPHGDVFGPRK
jgi:hypothetical protein